MQYDITSENLVASLKRQTGVECFSSLTPWLVQTPPRILASLTAECSCFLLLPKQLSVHRQVLSAVGWSHGHQQ